MDVDPRLKQSFLLNLCMGQANPAAIAGEDHHEKFENKLKALGTRRARAGQNPQVYYLNLV